MLAFEATRSLGSGVCMVVSLKGDTPQGGIGRKSNRRCAGPIRRLWTCKNGTRPKAAQWPQEAASGDGSNSADDGAVSHRSRPEAAGRGAGSERKWAVVDPTPLKPSTPPLASGERDSPLATPLQKRKTALAGRLSLQQSGGKGTRTPDLIHAMDALYQN
jgi:hypothetical protein